VIITSYDQWTDQFGTYQPPDDGIAGAARRGRPLEPPALPPDTSATVFFTSGTTGVRRARYRPHQAVTRLFGPARLAGFGPGLATPQVAALPWDMYAFELWGQLTAGGTVVLISANYLMPGTLQRIVRTHGADTLWMTASLFVDEDLDRFSGLAHVLAGGEKMSPAHVPSFLLRHPGIALWNGCGPAESCMLTTTRRLTLADCDRPGGVPVGLPVPGTSVALLDSRDERCTPGAAGGIYNAGHRLHAPGGRP
jgi:D-alanine--poly(phosphoribitol) ligase subunit 1